MAPTGDGAVADVDPLGHHELAAGSDRVATHIERILAKLGVRSRAQAVAAAYRDALVP